jgi:hypothetical protein
MLYSLHKPGLPLYTLHKWDVQEDLGHLHRTLERDFSGCCPKIRSGISLQSTFTRNMKKSLTSRQVLSEMLSWKKSIFWQQSHIRILTLSRPFVSQINTTKCKPLSTIRRKVFKEALVWILKVPPKVNVLKAWSPRKGAVGGIFKRWSLVEGS